MSDITPEPVRDPIPTPPEGEPPADEPGYAPPVAGYGDTNLPTPEPPLITEEPARYQVPPITPAEEPAVARGDDAPIPTEHKAGRVGCGIIAAAAVIALVVAAFAGVAAGFLGARLASGGFGGMRGVITDRPARVTLVPSQTEEPAVAAAAAAVPSVVNIDIRGGTTKGGDSGLPNSHPNVPTMGNGSGVAYKPAPGGGTYIITNNHVVEEAKSIVVRDESGRSVPAKVVGRDPETDIAVVQIGERVPAILKGDSGKLVVGQTVVAIGSPFGLEHTVTEGVVSALGRSLPDFSGAPSNAYPLVDVIQTDAAINPGNSGGALVDRQGRLVGINTAIYSDSGSSGGIGFAVPVNTAIRVADQIVAGNEITHPFIGIIGQTVTPELAQQQKITAKEGAYVADLAKGSGAEKAGVKVGDVVVAVDGVPVRSMDDLILQVRRKRVGDMVKISVLRDGKPQDFQVKVGDKPANLTTPKQESTGTAP